MRSVNQPRDLAHLLSQVERRVTNQLREILRREGCAIEEWRVLTLLSDGVGHTMTEIAEYALLPAPTLTKVIDRLVATKVVYRRIDAEDRRRVRAFLTPRGRDLYRRLAHQVEHCQTSQLAATRDGQALRELLVRLADTLSDVSAVQPARSRMVVATTSNASTTPASGTAIGVSVPASTNTAAIG